METVSIIGVGRVGAALALALSAKGYKIVNLFIKNNGGSGNVIAGLDPTPTFLDSTEFDKISEDIVFITTQDPEISKVAQDLAKALDRGASYVFHTSGSLSSDVLKSLAEKAIKIGSIHPLTSISEPILGAKRFKGAYFCIEGDPEAVKLAKKIVRDLGGKPFSIPTEKKSLYHASAVTACGHFVALIDVAAEMLSKCGFSRGDSKDILMPLIESTVDNLREQTLQAALTGTFSRGDIQTLDSHLKTLTINVSNEELAIYIMLGKRSLTLARRSGLPDSTILEMFAKISEFDENIEPDYRNEKHS